MPPHRTHRDRAGRRQPSGALAGLLAGVVWALCPSLVLVGCSANRITTPPTIPPAEPAVAPTPAQQPAGTVRPLAGRPAGAVFDTATSTLAVFSPGADDQTPAVLTVFGDTQVRTVALPGPATTVAGDDRGHVYLATRGGYFTVDLAGDRVTRIDVDDAADTDFTAVARRPDDTTVLGSADGVVAMLSAEDAGRAHITGRSTIFARVDQIVTLGDITVVLDRGQTSVTALGPDGRPRQALRAGQGSSTLAADPIGVVLAADTRGGQLLVYGADPLMLRQQYPVSDVPYGVAGCAGLAWVSQTAANTVVGYDLTTGIPVEKVRYPTVQQPNTLACDDSGDTLYVVSAAGGGVQAIPHPAAK